MLSARSRVRIRQVLPEVLPETGISQCMGRQVDFRKPWKHRCFTGIQRVDKGVCTIQNPVPFTGSGGSSPPSGTLTAMGYGDSRSRRLGPVPARFRRNRHVFRLWQLRRERPTVVSLVERFGPAHSFVVRSAGFQPALAIRFTDALSGHAPGFGLSSSPSTVRLR